MTANLAPARRVAFQILQKISADKGNSDALLHGALLDGLSQVDRNLCTALVLGTLRWQSAIDAQIRPRLSQPTVALAEPIALALQLGAFQLLCMDRIPAHAAIFESVEWVKHSEHPRAAGMVNAVLRKFAGMPKSAALLPEKAYAEWMLTRWRTFYGRDVVGKICDAGQHEVPVALRLFDSAVEEELRFEGVTLAPGELVVQARLVVAGDVFSTRAAREGRIHFQDEGSQLIAELLGASEQVDMRVLDCCAAPGGKTAILLENNSQASLVACDVNPTRLKNMQQRLDRAGWRERTTFHIADAAQLPEMGKFDRILCDVPCSGTGTLARNPEIRHRLQLAEITRQAHRQRKILASALRRLSLGGRLLYSTCSLEPEENEAVVEKVLTAENHTQATYALVDLQAEFQGRVAEGRLRGAAASQMEATGFRAGYLRTLPGVHPCDGFFAAMMERKA